MLQHSAFTLSAPAPAMAGQISRHMVKGWLGELFMSLALVAAGVDLPHLRVSRYHFTLSLLPCRH